MTDTHTQDEIDAAELAYLQRTVPDHELAIQRMRESVPEINEVLAVLYPLRINRYAKAAYEQHVRMRTQMEQEIERHLGNLADEHARLAELSA